MLIRITRYCFLATLVFEIKSFYHTNQKLVRCSRSLRMAYNTFVTVDSQFETPCSLIADEGASLSNYMQLPVDQYVCIKMPLDATLERMEGSRFNMTVPPVRFFTLDVSPTIICNVAQNEEYVTIESSECTLRGSPYVVGLNGCYRLKISATFSWFDSPTKKMICSRTTIGLEVDPPAPFKYFGKSILETTGRLALSVALTEIGNAFVQALANDYERWATSVTYRIERAEGLCPVSTDDVSSSVQLSSRSEVASQLPLAYVQDNTPVSTSIAEPLAKSLPESQLILAAGMVASDSTEESDIKLADIVTKNSLPVLTDDICLFPGSEPIVRVEEAPSNARRIFTGVDIMADMESIWEVLTAFETLQDVVPSLVKNEVVFRTPEGGARLAQVGGAKVLPGITFTAKTVLDVCVYKEDNPLADAMLAESSADGTPSADVRAYGKALPLKRGIFPRPYSLTRLPHRDITMQNVLGEGDFEHYQGVWRMQSLPNCAPNGGNASRLTYAVELKPKGILPVKLIEGRIASDLKANMAAIRKFVEAAELKRPPRLPVVAAVTDVSTPATKSVSAIAEVRDSATDVVALPLIVSVDSIEHEVIPGEVVNDNGTKPQSKGKRAAVRRFVSSLFGRNRDRDRKVVHATEDVENVPIDSGDVVSASLVAESASSPITEVSTGSGTLSLLEENIRLKNRVAFLEEEMAKANRVLRRIEMLSKSD